MNEIGWRSLFHRRPEAKGTLANLTSPEVLELYRERTISTISEIKTGSAVRSRYNDLKVAAAAAASL